eukprot:TRINITY_DN35_c0_g1_i11.p1 TRINITY_DN35_c0_g1~~TRINITY_DN35_c0_g1_i11.p1  ORF type:complete len:206 (+),score=66.64 TRINITY_DN35_c0_g1_i11:63-680(+)
MSHHAEIRSALLKETTDGTYKKHSSVKVSELVEPKVVVERRDWPGSVWGVYRATGVMKGDWDKAVGMVKAMVDDIKISKLMSPVKSMKTVEKEEDGIINYRVESIPWPLSDREGLGHVSTELVDDKTFVYAVRSVPGAKQVNKDNVLCEVFILGYVLKKLDGDKISLCSVKGIDPKGNIPEMIMSGFISDHALALGKFQKHLLKK